MSLNSSKSVFHLKVQYFQERKYNFLPFPGRGDTFFKNFFYLCVSEKIKCSHSNVHNSISGFVPCDRFADNARQVHCGSEHGKNEVFTFPLFHLRLTRINVESIYTSYEANTFSLLAAFGT